MRLPVAAGGGVPPDWLVVPGLAVFHLAMGFLRGPVLTSDGFRDAAYARALVDAGFHIGRFLEQAQAMGSTTHPMFKVFYLAYIHLLALLQSAFGEGWADALIAINAAAQTLTAYLVLSLAWRATRSLAVWVTALAFLVALADFHQWVAMTQSDAIFVTMATAVFALATRAAAAGRSARRLWIAAAAIAAVGAVSRPTWPPVLGMAVSAALLAGALAEGPLAALRRWRLLMLLLLGAAAIAIPLSAALHFDPSVMPFAGARDILLRWRPYFEGGVAVISRPETYLGPRDSFLEFATVPIARLAYFFWFTADGFDSAHGLANIAGHAPLYVLAMIGTFTAVRGSVHGLALAIGLIATIWIAMTAAFHAVTILDFDWRYRAPVYPALILLAGLGVAYLERRLRECRGSPAHGPGDAAAPR